VLEDHVFSLSDLKTPKHGELEVFIRDGGKAGVRRAWEYDIDSRAGSSP